MTYYPYDTKLHILSFLTAFTALFILSGCARPEHESGPILPETDFSYETAPSRTENRYDTDIRIITEDDSMPPRAGMARSRLTNEWVDEKVSLTRPIAVMIPNENAALPHYNLSRASVLYEANVEGRITRLMAVFEDWQDLVRVGNVRSARTYYAYWAFEWDAFFVHYGGPYYINDLMAEDTTDDIDGLSGNDSAFYRSKDRPNPHNVYTDGALLAECIRKNHYSTDYRGLADEEHFRFAPKSAPNTLSQYDDTAYNAVYIDLSGAYPLTRCYFEFNESDGLYYRSQHLSGGSDSPHADADGTKLAFKNVLIQYIKQEVLDEKGYLVMQCHDDSRDGWFFTNGKGIHVNWVKESDYGATRYYDDAGNEIVLNTGKTMICIVNETDSFTFR